MTCAIDDDKNDCSISLILDKMPQVLLVHIDRYYYSAQSQVLERIPFHMEVNQEIQLNSFKYAFKCPILHIGSRTSGQYKLLVNDGNDYYIYDDALINRIEDFNYSNFDENYELLMYEKVN